MANPSPGDVVLTAGDRRLRCVSYNEEQLLVSYEILPLRAVQYMSLDDWETTVERAGCYTDSNGTLRTPSGERSIFDDVDE